MKLKIKRHPTARIVGSFYWLDILDCLYLVRNDDVSGSSWYLCNHWGQPRRHQPSIRFCADSLEHTVSCQASFNTRWRVFVVKVRRERDQWTVNYVRNTSRDTVSTRDNELQAPRLRSTHHPSPNVQCDILIYNIDQFMILCRCCCGRWGGGVADRIALCTSTKIGSFCFSYSFAFIQG